MKCRTVIMALVAVALLTAGWTAQASLNPGYESVVLSGVLDNPIKGWLRLLANGSYENFEIPTRKILILTEMDVAVGHNEYVGGTCSIGFGGKEDFRMAFFTKITNLNFNVNMTTGLAVARGADLGVLFQVPPGTTDPDLGGLFVPGQVLLRGYLMPIELKAIPGPPGMIPGR